MNYEMPFNPVPAADIPRQVLPGPEQQHHRTLRRRHLGDAVALFLGLPEYRRHGLNAGDGEVS
jgi:hypothetical protein